MKEFLILHIHLGWQLRHQLAEKLLPIVPESIKMGVLMLPHEEGNPKTSPATGFEGSEKRLEVEFFALSDTGRRSLRSLTREQLTQLLDAAQCTIVSELSNAFVDSYVLSESSLFVFSHKIVLKTCGTTKLLSALPLLMHYASCLDLKPKCCKYTRGNFIFPSDQPYPHRNFNEEVSFLDLFFGTLGLGSQAYVMGDVAKLQTWHIYSASAVSHDSDHDHQAPIYTLEMAMTQLDRKSASNFFGSTCSTASEMTHTSGIRQLLPSSHICDFAFDPCGYSMNSLEASAVSTIHVTPEEGFSYASFEAMGYDPQTIILPSIVNKVASCFRPASFSLAVHVNGVSAYNDQAEALSWGDSICPQGYHCNGTSRQELPGRCIIVFHTFQLSGSDFPSICPRTLFELRKNASNCDGEHLSMEQKIQVKWEKPYEQRAAA